MKMHYKDYEVIFLQGKITTKNLGAFIWTPVWFFK